MLYLLYKISFFGMRLISRNAAYRIAFFFARLKYIFSLKDRALVKENLRIALPGKDERDISRLTKGVFENFTRYLIDFFSFRNNQRGFLKEMVQFVNLENLDAALGLGKGCVIMTGHFGNWELAGCALADAGYKTNAIALNHADSRINNFFIDQRRAAGMQVMAIGEAKAACQSALSRGESIAILGDRPFGDRGVEIEFFGKKAIFPRGAALFSLKKEAPVVFAFSFRDGEEETAYKMVFEKPFVVQRQGAIEGQLKKITQKFANKFEDYIQKYPSQWYMFNKVWKE